MIVFCLQFALAVFSAINASVLASQDDKFSTFPNSCKIESFLECNLSSLKDIIVAVSALGWVLVFPILGALLNWMWADWRKGLNK